jgi:DNA processing protein
VPADPGGPGVDRASRGDEPGVVPEPELLAEAPPSERGWPPGFGAGEDRVDLVRLATLRGIRPLHLHALAWRVGTAGACVAEIRAGRAGTDGDRRRLASIDPDAVLGALERLGGRFAGPGDPEYLPRLEDLEDPPPALFILGAPLRPRPPMVAVVGARRCTPSGRELATDLGRGLAAAGLVVVSGAARGIDEAAHRGALAARGSTVAVLGAGIDRSAPRTGHELLVRIVEAGGTVVSEYPPGEAPRPMHFPARNRLIAALAVAVVVVEGVARSGSRITADHALDLGRDVFAVPGSVTSERAATPNALIREGATLIRGVEDLLVDLGLAGVGGERSPPALEGDAARVWGLLDLGLPDAIAREAGLSVTRTIEVLVDLEVRGLVRATGGRYQPRATV